MSRVSVSPLLRQLLQLLQLPIEPEPGQRGENLSCFPEIPYGSMATNSCANLSETPTPQRCSVCLSQTCSLLSLHLTPATESRSAQELLHPCLRCLPPTCLPVAVDPPASFSRLLVMCCVSFPAVWSVSYSPAGHGHPVHPLFTALLSSPPSLSSTQLGSRGTRLFGL